MSATDSQHTFTLTIDGTNRWTVIDAASVRMQEAEGGEIDTLQFDIDDANNNITVTPWDVVVWTADGTTKLFGGYVTSVKMAANASTLGRVLSVACESYVTRMHKAEIVGVAYTDTTPGTIVAGLFSLAGITDFDTSTHVTAGSALTYFAVDNEKLPDALDRLAAIEGWTWRVDADKALWFGAASSDAATFGVSDETNADYSSLYPAEPGLTITTQANEIRNKIVVHGGSTTSDITTEAFTGDASTVTFNLAQIRIKRIHVITVGGTRQKYGVLGWHTYVGDSMDVLVNYRAGYVVFNTAPGNGVAVSISYTYDSKLEWTQSDSASITKYGITFVHHIYDSSITSSTEAGDVATQMLADYADSYDDGSFRVRRLGLHAGQQVTLRFDVFGINSTYTIRSVAYEMAPAVGYLICTAKFGGRSRRISRMLGGGGQGEEPYGRPTEPIGGGDIGGAHVWDYDAVGTGTFTAP